MIIAIETVMSKVGHQGHEEKEKIEQKKPLEARVTLGSKNKIT
ncbi:MAG: hypothetical protein BMS9Abin31_0172 [Gammaproteobacteria bacterium]|nr:MAG: hypothetical protein BMS9Abin31_0172 [Gammaproteobacteria bacterium]